MTEAEKAATRTAARVISMTDADSIHVHHDDEKIVVSATDDDGQTYWLDLHDVLRLIADEAAS